MYLNIYIIMKIAEIKINTFGHYISFFFLCLFSLNFSEFIYLLFHHSAILNTDTCFNIFNITCFLLGDGSNKNAS